MKRTLLALAAAALCMAVAVGGTMAYFTSQTQTHNVITTGAVEIAIDETMAVPGPDGTVRYEKFPANGLTGVMPGAKQSKIVRIVNQQSSADAWLRVRVDRSITLAENTPTAQADPGLIELDINTQHWLDGQDGYYYYKTAVKPGQATEPLFTTVSFSPQMDNLYQGCAVHVDVTAYAVQAANNPIPQGKTVRDVQGWPVDTEGKEG